MVLYFFHVHDGTSMLDDTGSELPGIGAAKVEALKLTGGLLKDGRAGESFWSGRPWRLEVTDSPDPGGRSFFVLHFSVIEEH